MTRETVRIGCASAFWGDSTAGAEQLVRRGEIDFLVFDYLAEITMSLLARARARKPELGYVPDFVEAIAPLLPEIKQKGIRIVSNAGGINPQAAATALRRKAEEAGITLNIAVVTGDDLTSRADEIRAAGVTEMFSGAAMPEKLTTMNAYLGAQPIALALDRGADVVITGRCVDSAVVLGPMVHAFGWSWTDYDKLAQGSLAGHLLECAAQVTGGLFTDWRDVPGWDDMGMPIAVCSADGSFVVTKPPGTGGLVVPLSVCEQMLYEIGDPAAYILPDVVCDFRDVSMTVCGPDQVRVTGARGRPPTPTLKVSATWHDGYRVIGTLTIGGYEAAAKAERTGEAILARVRRLLSARGIPYFSETSIEVLGSESMYGPWRHPAAQGQPRGRAQDRCAPSRPGSSRNVGARNLSAWLVDGAGDHRLLRRTPGRAAGAAALFLPLAEGEDVAGRAFRWSGHQRSVRAFTAIVAVGGRTGRTEGRRRCRRNPAADCIGGWPQRRQGQFRQYRPDRPQAGLSAVDTRRADGGGRARLVRASRRDQS